MYDSNSKRDAHFLTNRDDSRIPSGIRIRGLKKGGISYKRWFLPLSWGHLTLQQAYDYLTIVGAPQGKIPEVIRWTEGKDSQLVKQFFYGGVDLRAHDYIHILLGRGLLPKDEAFVIGFTMGSTNRLHTMNEDAFTYIAKHHYPNAYRMDDDSRSVFLDASKLGSISDCIPLDEIDFKPLLHLSIDEVRKRINLKTGLLEAYYRDIEQQRFPEDPASRRLVHSAYGSRDPWSLQFEDQTHLIETAVQETNAQLDASDQPVEIDESVFNETLDQHFKAVLHHLKEQRVLAQHCFEEINKVLQYEDAQAKKDVADERWNSFYESSHQNVEKARTMLLREIRHSSWDGYDTEERELRTWLHALLGRADSPRDRAFTRGFFHGTSNQRSSYASQLKLDLMREMPLCKDGLYSADMDEVYRDGVHLGYLSNCRPLEDFDFTQLEGMTLSEARKHLNISTALLTAYHNEIENQRLLL